MEQGNIRTVVSFATSITSSSAKVVSLHDVTQGEYDLLLDYLKFLRSGLKQGKYNVTLFYDNKTRSIKVDVENSKRLRHTI